MQRWKILARRKISNKELILGLEPLWFIRLIRRSSCCVFDLSSLHDQSSCLTKLQLSRSTALWKISMPTHHIAARSDRCCVKSSIHMPLLSGLSVGRWYFCAECDRLWSSAQWPTHPVYPLTLSVLGTMPGGRFRKGQNVARIRKPMQMHAH